MDATHGLRHGYVHRRWPSFSRLSIRPHTGILTIAAQIIHHPLLPCSGIFLVIVASTVMPGIFEWAWSGGCWSRFFHRLRHWLSLWCDPVSCGWRCRNSKSREPVLWVRRGPMVHVAFQFGLLEGPRGSEREVLGPSQWHPQQSFSFLRRLLAALLRCTSAPGSQRNPTEGGRQRMARGRARGECGPSFADGVPFGTGAVGALRWTRLASYPLARRRAPTLHMHTPAESVLCAEHYHALHRHALCPTRVCAASGAVALCRHVNE